MISIFANKGIDPVLNPKNPISSAITDPSDEDIVEPAFSHKNTNSIYAFTTSPSVLRKTWYSTQGIYEDGFPIPVSRAVWNQRGIYQKGYWEYGSTTCTPTYCYYKVENSDSTHLNTVNTAISAKGGAVDTLTGVASVENSGGVTYFPAPPAGGATGNSDETRFKLSKISLSTKSEEKITMPYFYADGSYHTRDINSGTYYFWQTVTAGTTILKGKTTSGAYLGFYDEIVDSTRPTGYAAIAASKDEFNSVPRKLLACAQALSTSSNRFDYIAGDPAGSRVLIDAVTGALQMEYTVNFAGIQSTGGYFNIQMKTQGQAVFNMPNPPELSIQIDFDSTRTNPRYVYYSPYWSNNVMTYGFVYDDGIVTENSEMKAVSETDYTISVEIPESQISHVRKITVSVYYNLIEDISTLDAWAQMFASASLSIDRVYFTIATIGEVRAQAYYTMETGLRFADDTDIGGVDLQNSLFLDQFIDSVKSISFSYKLEFPAFTSSTDTATSWKKVGLYFSNEGWKLGADFPELWKKNFDSGTTVVDETTIITSTSKIDDIIRKLSYWSTYSNQYLLTVGVQTQRNGDATLSNSYVNVDYFYVHFDIESISTTDSQVTFNRAIPAEVKWDESAIISAKYGLNPYQFSFSHIPSDYVYTGIAPSMIFNAPTEVEGYRTYTFTSMPASFPISLHMFFTSPNYLAGFQVQYFHEVSPDGYAGTASRWIRLFDETDFMRNQKYYVRGLCGDQTHLGEGSVIYQIEDNEDVLRQYTLESEERSFATKEMPIYNTTWDGFDWSNTVQLIKGSQWIGSGAWEATSSFSKGSPRIYPNYEIINPNLLLGHYIVQSEVDGTDNRIQLDFSILIRQFIYQWLQTIVKDPVIIQDFFNAILADPLYGVDLYYDFLLLNDNGPNTINPSVPGGSQQTGLRTYQITAEIEQTSTRQLTWDNTLEYDTSSAYIYQFRDYLRFQHKSSLKIDSLENIGLTDTYDFTMDFTRDTPFYLLLDYLAINIRFPPDLLENRYFGNFINLGEIPALELGKFYDQFFLYQNNLENPDEIGFLFLEDSFRVRSNIITTRLHTTQYWDEVAGRWLTFSYPYPAEFTESLVKFNFTSNADNQYSVMAVQVEYKPASLYTLENISTYLEIDSGDISLTSFTIDASYLFDVKYNPGAQYLNPTMYFNFTNNDLINPKTIEIDEIAVVPYFFHEQTHDRCIFRLLAEDFSPITIEAASNITVPIQIDYSGANTLFQKGVYSSYIKFHQTGELVNSTYLNNTIFTEVDRYAIGHVYNYTTFENLNGIQEAIEGNFTKQPESTQIVYYLMDEEGFGSPLTASDTYSDVLWHGKQFGPTVEIISPINGQLFQTGQLHINSLIGDPEGSMLGATVRVWNEEYDSGIMNYGSPLGLQSLSLSPFDLVSGKLTIAVEVWDSTFNYAFATTTCNVESYKSTTVNMSLLKIGSVNAYSVKNLVQCEIPINYTDSTNPTSLFRYLQLTGYNDAENYRIRRDQLHIYYPQNNPSQGMSPKGALTYWKFQSYQKSDTLQFTLNAPLVQWSSDSFLSQEHAKVWQIIIPRNTNLRTYSDVHIIGSLSHTFDAINVFVFDITQGLNRSITDNCSLLYGWGGLYNQEFQINFTVPEIKGGVEYRYRVIIAEDLDMVITRKNLPLDIGYGLMIGIVGGIILRELLNSASDRYTMSDRQRPKQWAIWGGIGAGIGLLLGIFVISASIIPVLILP